jgi:hypothetical protein
VEALAAGTVCKEAAQLPGATNVVGRPAAHVPPGIRAVTAVAAPLAMRAIATAQSQKSLALII